MKVGCIVADNPACSFFYFLLLAVYLPCLNKVIHVHCFIIAKVYFWEARASPAAPQLFLPASLSFLFENGPNVYYSQY